ncbi:hypothetical protein [Clostridium tagluense]|uniref:Uncharacterized protein n=1 Tax=Clostridium tagluense TaxID=360422 RepID=A0A401UQQ9_9CLOT|nr:hypothetical protein [Clostridium tagluense]GCD11864.1 hypothetical protein Ctaglu_34870 [Clostridium tagluense]
MYKLEGIIKVEINSKVIYCNNNYNHIGVLSKNEITSPKASGNDIDYTYIQMQEEDATDRLNNVIYK